MQLGQKYIEQLRDDIRQKPLQLDEIRRVEGVGSLYMALIATTVDNNEYTELYELFIDDIGYKFYAKDNSSAAQSA